MSLKSALATVEAGLTDHDWKESTAATTRRPNAQEEAGGVGAMPIGGGPGAAN